MATDQRGADPRQAFGIKCHQREQQGLGGAPRAVEGASGRPVGRWKVKVPRKQPAANIWKVNSGNH